MLLFLLSTRISPAVINDLSTFIQQCHKCGIWFGWVYSLLDKELAEWLSAKSGGEWS